MLPRFPRGARLAAGGRRRPAGLEGSPQDLSADGATVEESPLSTVRLRIAALGGGPGYELLAAQRFFAEAGPDHR